MSAWRHACNRAADALERWIGLDLVLAASRLGIGAVFFYSGRTKVDGLLQVTDGAVALFRDEYRLPIVDPAFAAHAASTCFRCCSCSVSRRGSRRSPCSA